MFRRKAWLWLGLALGAGVANAQADVLEIAEDGAVTTYRGPVVYTDEGARAVALPSPRPPAPAAAVAVRHIIAQAAARHALNPELVEAVAWQESRLRPHAVSSKGAIGVMQLMPGTARDLGVDPFDTTQNVLGGAAYLAQLLRRYGGDVRLALAAYNAGPGAVDRHGGVPPFAETQRYVAAILARLTPAAR